MYACYGILLQIIGSSLGVLAAYSGGEGNQTLRLLANLLVLSVAAAAATTATCSWLVGDILRNVRACLPRCCGVVVDVLAHRLHRLHIYQRPCTYHYPIIQRGKQTASAATFSTPSWYQLPPSPLPPLFCAFAAQGGSAGIIILATVASLGSTTAFTLLKHNTLLRRAAAAGALDDRDDLDALPRSHADRAPLMGPKEV